MGQALEMCVHCENKRGCDTCTDLHNWIMEHLEPKQEWISVKDRLPNRGERVLCFMKSYGKNQNDTISDNVYNGILVGSNPPKYVWEWNGDYVTHWMPLPEEPEWDGE